MGKASRWMINFLLGRKQKERKKETASLSFPEEKAAIFSASTFNKRWSFGKKSASMEITAHRSSRSLDSITAASLVAAATQATKTRVPIDTRSRANEDAAATRIQAAFRSYLARRALCALRALVKLQALVRGHLVRKQMEATVRGMHALMTIQVRARFQRIQTAEEPKSQSSRYRSISLEKEFPRAHREAIPIVNKYGYTNHKQKERIKHRLTTYHSGDLSVSKRKHQHEKFSATALSSPLYSLAGSWATSGGASFNCQHQDHPYLPNYMINTQSSKAKVRSQSEPKQRPKQSMQGMGKGKEKSTADDMNVVQQVSPAASSKQLTIESQELWFVKLY
ncbi:hypothetical protein SLE2022_084740 [Rubroshorea leprosula]